MGSFKRFANEYQTKLKPKRAFNLKLSSRSNLMVREYQPQTPSYLVDLVIGQRAILLFDLN